MPDAISSRDGSSSPPTQNRSRDVKAPGRHDVRRDQTIGCLEGQGIEQHAVDDAENRRIRTDAEPQREKDRGREPGRRAIDRKTNFRSWIAVSIKNHPPRSVAGSRVVSVLGPGARTRAFRQ